MLAPINVFLRLPSSYCISFSTLFSFLFDCTVFKIPLLFLWIPYHHSRACHPISLALYAVCIFSSCWFLFILLWSGRTFFKKFSFPIFVKTSFVSFMWSVLEEVLWAAEKNVYSTLFVWCVLSMSMSHVCIQSVVSLNWESSLLILFLFFWLGWFVYWWELGWSFSLLLYWGESVSLYPYLFYKIGCICIWCLV